MAFPQQSDPQIIHLFFDEFDTLFSASTLDIQSFYNFCKNNCINFLCFTNGSNLLLDNSTQINEFLLSGLTNYGICDFSMQINLFDPQYDGLNEFLTIQSFNQNYTYTPLTWVTVRNDFWRYSTKATTTYSESADVNPDKVTVILSNGVNTSSPMISVGNFIRIYGENRQIKQLQGSNKIIVDRPFSVAWNNATMIAVETTDIIDYDTFIYRLKKLKKEANLSDIKVEVYTPRVANPSQTSEIASVLDRSLIEYDITIYNYCLYNQNNLSQTIRQTLLNLTSNKTGTVSTYFGSNIISGLGTDFANDLQVGSKISISGQVFTIASISPIGNPQQATALENATLTVTNTTYSPYFEFMPIFNINQTLRRNWFISPTNSKNYADVYKLFTISGYTVGSNVQSGNSPICYNEETDLNIINSTDLKGVSVYRYSNAISIDNSVKDGELCSICKESLTFPIELSGTNTTCSSASNGTITAILNPTNLTPPFTYSFSGQNGVINIVSSANTVTCNNLYNGNWFVSVTDSGSPTKQSTVETIILSETFDYSIITSGNTIIFTFSGGTPTYDISSVPAGSFFESGLTDGSYTYTANSGTYTFEISDSFSCLTESITVTVISATTIAINANYANPTCNKASNGIINVNVNSPGVLPYTYTFIKNEGQETIVSSSTTVTNVSAGNWTVFATDANSIESNYISFTLTPTFDATINTTINSATIGVSGGTPPYTISGTTIPPFSAQTMGGFTTYPLLPSGNIIFTVTDANGCSENLPASIPVNGLVLDINILSYLNTNSDTCPNGEVTVSGIGGVPPYSYSATNTTNSLVYTNTTGIFTGLTSGFWQFTVVDSSIVGINTSNIGITLSNLFDVSFYSSGQTLCINASGGTTGYYSINLNGNLYLYDTGSTINCFPALCGNNYLEVIDGNIADPFAISLFSCDTFSANTYVVCPLGLIYSATSVSCEDTHDGSVHLIATGGTPPYSYGIWNEPMLPFGIDNFTGIFNNLTSQGSWSGYTIDASGNTVFTTFSVAKDFYKDVQQYGTGFCITVSGGTAPYTFLWTKNNASPLRPSNNIPPGQITNRFTATTEGEYCFSAICGNIYSLVVLDANECLEDEEPFIFLLYCPLELILLNVKNVSCSADTDGSISVYGNGGVEPYIVYSAVNGSTVYTSLNGVFTNLSGGTWNVYVEDSIGQIANLEVDVNSLGIDLITSVNYSAKTWCVEATSFKQSLYYLTINGDTGNTQTILDGTTYCYPISGCGETNFDISVCRIPFAYQRLFSFSNTSGSAPLGTLFENPFDGLLYGTTSQSGDFSYGTVYRYNRNTNTTEVLHHFSGSTYGDGANPDGGLIRFVSTNKLYGVTQSGGLNNLGTIFSIRPNGQYEKLHDFSGGVGGENPTGTLVRSGSVLYGTTISGGDNSSGTIFSYDFISNTFNVIHNFSGITDGFYPTSLLLSGNILYGTTGGGGLYGYGTFYRKPISGTFTVLDNFSSIAQTPLCGLILVNNIFYGTTTLGGDFNSGTVYSCNTTGNIGVIHSFTGSSGMQPQAELVRASDGFLYGVTLLGGDFNYGTVYRISTNGDFTKMHDFDNTILDGVTPYARLIQTTDRSLYGTTSAGGENSIGTIFKIDTYDSVCCSETTINIGNPLDINLTETYISGVRNICVDVNLTNSFPPPYDVLINGITYGYDPTQNENCYPVNQCSEIDVTVCNRYFSDMSLVLSFGDGTPITPKAITEINGNLFGVTSTSIFSCDTQGNNFEVLYGPFNNTGISRRGITLSTDKNIIYGRYLESTGSQLDVFYSFDLLSGIFTALDTTGFSDVDYNRLYPPIIASNNKLYGFSVPTQIGNYGAIYSYDLSSSTYTIDYTFSSNTTTIVTPYSYPIEASDGKIYGLATYGPNPIDGGGIFSYDYNTNTYAVEHIFTGGTNEGYRPSGGLVEINGLLYGLVTVGGTYNIGGIFTYDINTKIVNHIHQFTTSLISITNGGKFLNLNGILYLTTDDGGEGGNTGTIFSFNTFNNHFEYINYPPFPSGSPGICYPMGVNPFSQELVNIGNDIYGITENGGPPCTPNTQYNGGTIFKLTFDTCCVSETYPAISGFTGFSATLTPIDIANSQLCIDINEYIFFQPPYTININDAIYSVTGTTGHCYTISGCGVFDVVVCSDVNGIGLSGCCYEYSFGIACGDITISTVSTNIPCGDNSGIISVFATGGTSFYNFELTNGLTTYNQSGIYNQVITFTGLTAGLWNLTVTDTNSTIATQQYNLSNFLVDYSYQGNQVCLSISSTTYTASTFFVVVNGTTYGYDNTLTGNCYTITGCGDNTLFIYELITNNLNYTILNYFTGGTSPLVDVPSYSTLIELLPNIFYGTTNICLYSADTLGNIAPVVDLTAFQPTRYLYLKDGIIYGSTVNGGTNSTGIIYSCDTSGNYGVFFNPSFVYLLKDCNPPLIKHSNGIFYGPAQFGINSILFSCDTQNNGSIITSIPSIVNREIISLIEGSNGTIYGITNTSSFINGGSIFSSDTFGNVAVINEIPWLAPPPQINGTYSKLQEFVPGFIYSTSSYGGQYNGGTVFNFDFNGNINIIYEFNGTTDGLRPKSPLFQGTNGLLYGTTEQGGSYGYGVVYALDVNGNNFSVLHNFESPALGQYPVQGIVEASNGNLYGISFFTQVPFDTTLIYELQSPYSGCSYFSSFDTPCELSINTITTDIPCFDFNGLIEALAFGGTPDYLYSLTNGVVTFTQTGTTNQSILFTGLTAGTYTLTVTDSGVFTAYTASTIYDLSNFDVTLSTSGSQVCIVVTSTTIPAQTYTVQLQGNTYPYTATTTGTCYTVTGCGITNVIVCNDVDTSVFKYYPIDSLIANSPKYSLTRVWDIFFGTSDYAQTIFSANTLGELGIVYSFSGDNQPLCTLYYASNGLLYGLGGDYTLASNRNFIFTIDISGNYNEIFSQPVPSVSFRGKLEESIDGYLLGTTALDGDYGYGTIFKIDLSGNNYTTLYSFSGGTTYEDGEYPESNLVRYQTNNIFYGITEFGGLGNGIMYTCNTLGNYGIIHKFSGTEGNPSPYARLIYNNNNNTLYGITYNGGNYGEGTIFSSDTQGNVGIIFEFNDALTQKGKTPYGGLVRIGNILYGNTYEGGSDGFGVIYSCDTTGNNFDVIYNFEYNDDNAFPQDTMVLGLDDNLYGITSYVDQVFYKVVLNPEEICCFYGNVNVSCQLYLNTVATNVPCFDNSGSISVLGFAGYPNYQYTLNGLLISATTTGTTNQIIDFTGLTPGFYNVTVVDTSGNTVTQAYDLTNFDVVVNFEINTASTGNEVCILLTSTTLTANTYYVEIEGNVYTYDTSSITGNCYTVTGCGTTFITISGGTSGCTYNTSVEVPCNLVLFTLNTNIPCELDSGIIEVTGFGGVPNYTYTLTGPSNSVVTGTTGQIISFSGLQSGQYSVSLVDSVGFNASSAITVFNLSYFDASVTTSNNQICVSLSGESLTANTYVVNIDGILYNYDTSSLTGNCYTVTGCGTTLVTISGGTSGCTYNASVDVSCQLFVDATTTSIPCETNSGIVSLFGFGGTPNYTYTITNGINQFTQTGTTNQTVVFTGLTSGSYSVNVFDSGGLTASTATTVLNLSYFDVDVEVNGNKVCITISADVLTANTYVVNVNNDTYIYDTSSLTGNCYTITGCGLTSINISGGTSGCTYQTGVEIPCTLLLFTSSSNIPCDDNSGVISAVAFAGQPNYIYNVTNGLVTFSQTGGTNETVYFSGLTAGQYNVSVVDNNGLTASTATTVFNLSFFDVSTSLNGNQLCVSISSATISAETYVVNVGQNTYNYNINTNPNCYTVTGCGTTNLTITSFIEGPINYGEALLQFNDDNYEVLLNSLDLPESVIDFNSLIEINNELYGMVTGNFFGSPQKGYIYKCDLSGNNLNILYQFSGHTFNNDGARPKGSLLLGSDGFVYGTTETGGITNPYSNDTMSGQGTFFKYDLINNQLTYVHLFSGFTYFDGAGPGSFLVEINNIIYGTTFRAGFSGDTFNGPGTIFSCDTSGNYGVFHYFAMNGTEGFQPWSLINGNDGYLYGVCYVSGPPEYGGTLFKIDFNGNLNVLHYFSGTSYNDGSFVTSVILGSNGILYGTTQQGGTNDHGTIFSCDTSGNNYGIIHNFNSVTDGRWPQQNLIEYYNTGIFFGTTAFGSTSNAGTVFTCNTSGDFGVIHIFDVVNLGRPRGQLLLASNGSLYGTTSSAHGVYSWNIVSTAQTISSCTYTTTIELPCELTLGVVSSSIPCETDSGVISLLASAGTPYYTYTIVGPGPITFTQTGNTSPVTFSGLPAGIYDISVIDNGGLSATTAATIFNLSFFEVDINVNGNQICLTISSSTLSADTYFVQLQGNTYTYDAALSANCYTVTGCGLTDITVVTGAPGIASEYEYGIIHHFSGSTYGDGSNPFTNSLIYYNNQLVGTTRFGGINEGGTVFKLDEDGSNYDVFVSFTAKTGNTQYSLGEEPVSRLIIGPGNNLYGSTSKGGYYTTAGVLFSCNTSGNLAVPNGGNGFGAGNQGLTLHSNGKFYRASSTYGVYGSIGHLEFGSIPVSIHTFDGFSGSFPYDGLTEYPPTGILYGVTHDSSGLVVPIGNYGGVIFSINPDGTNYTVLHQFSGMTYGDGANPFCRLFLASNGLFYGNTEYGGLFDAGVIFTCNTTGDYGIIYHFQGFAYEDGENPMGTLTQDPTGKLYGVTQSGGRYNFGTAYVINDDGSGYQILHHFSGRTDGATDGAEPKGELSYINGSLYGMTFQGGNQGEFFGNGTIYKINVFNAPVTGCAFNATVEILCGGPLQIFSTITNIPCDQNDGSLTTTVTGGSPNYTYVLTNGITTYTQTGSVGDVINFNGLIPSNWTLTVTDSLGDIVTETYNIANIDVTFVTGLTNNELCVSIIGATVTGDTYLITLQGITYSYDAFAPFNCFTLTGCGDNNISISGSSGCNFEGIFNLPCPPLEVWILSTTAFCYNDVVDVAIAATGGTIPYTMELYQLSPLVTGFTATTIFYNIGYFPYNYAVFNNIPANGGIWYGVVTDANGNALSTNVLTLTNVYNATINFTATDVIISISGNTNFSGIIVNGVSYGPFGDGTYTYPLSCGTTTVIVNGYYSPPVFEGVPIPPYIDCVYSATTVIPCDLLCDVSFVQPQCSGETVDEITVFITGNTAPYTITIEQPITNVLYSNITSTSPFVMTGLSLTPGTWTVVVTDTNGDTCIQEIVVDPTFDAFVSAILSTTGFCVTISGSSPFYSIEIDGTNMGGNIYTNGTYCFSANCGTHQIVINNPFASPPCPINLTTNVPCPDLDCSVIFTDPTCGKEDGGVLITVNSGTPPYYYEITDGLITYDSGGFLPTNVYTFGNLGLGTWTVTVTDSAVPNQTCVNIIELQNSFQVVVSAYTATSLTYGLICFDISGGLPPYSIYIDNVLVDSGLTQTESICYTATCGVNHSYLVFDSGNPCIVYVNQNIFTNSSFDTNTDWIPPYLGISNCTNPTVNPAGYFSRYGYIDTVKGAFVYTALTSAIAGIGGCYQNVPLSQNYIFPYPQPLSVTYGWTIGTGLVSGISPGYLAFSINTPFGSSVPTTAPPFPGLLSYRSYSGIHTQNTTTIPTGVYSGYGFTIVESGGYSANTAGAGSVFEITGMQLTILSYTLPCPCAASGTTFVPCFVSLPIITVVTIQNPPCLVNPDGIIVVSGSSGAPPYTYSATNGTTSYTNTTGIFTGLTEDIWYLSLIDSLGQVSTTTEVVTLNYTFYANVDVNLTGFCITITGGTQPYVLYFDGDPLPWNYSNITNCYSADCQTTATIIVQDSSG